MLNLQAINEQIAKGDPKLRDVYLKLKAEAEGKLIQQGVKDVIQEAGMLPQEEGESKVQVTQDEEGFAKIAELAKGAQYTCSKCQKICANGTGLSAHERKCKA